MSSSSSSASPSSSTTTAQVTVSSGGVVIKTLFSETHLSLVQKMMYATDYWRQLFSAHNLFTCDTDGRRCECKTFFCEAVWNGRFRSLCDEIGEFYFYIFGLVNRPSPDLLHPRSERFSEVLAEYGRRAAEIVEWQAVHTASEETFLYGRLCRVCRSTALTFKRQALDLVTGGDLSGQGSPVVAATVRR